MKHLRLFLMVAVLLAPLSEAGAQEVSREALRAEADASYAGYDFAAALEGYHRLPCGQVVSKCALRDKKKRSAPVSRNAPLPLLKMLA